MWETCEIDVTFFSAPNPSYSQPYGGVGWGYGAAGFYTELWFQAKTTGRENVGRVVAESGKDELKRGEIRIVTNAKGEDDITTINETPWRQKLVASLIKELVDDGWEPAGKGKYWYSFRFRRSSSSEVVREIITLGNESLDRGEIRKAIEYFEKALKIAQDNSDRRSEGMALGRLGLPYSDLGEVRKAIEYFEKALKIAREIGDRSNESPLLICLGGAYVNLGELKKAIDYYEKALNIAQEIGDRRREGASIGSLGRAYSSLGELKKAIDYLEKALNIAQEIGDRGGESAWLGSLGLAYSSLGELKKAIDYLEKALNIALEIGDTGYEAIMLNYLGVVFVEEKKYKEALACYLLAKDIRPHIEDPMLRAIESNLKDLEEKLGRKEFEILASEVAPRAVEIVREILD